LLFLFFFLLLNLNIPSPCFYPVLLIAVHISLRICDALAHSIKTSIFRLFNLCWLPLKR
jgi:hypothetical protein